jgi:hypothetical protein
VILRIWQFFSKNNEFSWASYIHNGRKNLGVESLVKISNLM